MATNYGHFVDARRDPRRQPPVQSEDVSTPIKQHHHADTSATSLHTHSPPREDSTDDATTSSTQGQRKASTQCGASPGSSISPGLRSSAAEAVALMRKVPVRTAASPEKKDKRPQGKLVTEQSKPGTDEKKGHPVPHRSRSLHMDTQLRDSELEVQCVRGEGNVVVRHRQGESSLQDAQSSSSKAHIPDQKFPINHCWNKVRKVSRRSMKWIADMDGFEIPLDGEEKMRIYAEAVSNITYNINCRKFYLAPNPNTSADKHLEELVLKVGGDERTPFKLRSILEQRFGAVKVTQCEKAFLDDRERMFQQHNLFSVPPRSTSQPEVPYQNSSDGLEEGVVDDLNSLNAPTATKQPAFQAPKTLGDNTMPQPKHQRVEHVTDVSDQPPDVAHEGIKLVKRKVDKSKNLEVKRGKRKFTPLPSSQKSDELPASKQASVQRPADETSVRGEPAEQNTESGSQVMWAVVINRAIPPTDEVVSTPDRGAGNENKREVGPVSPSVSYPSGMYFRSGERVRINDLVVRVRDEKTMADGKNKLDKHDIYDGPFRIIEIPGPIETDDPSTDVDPDKSRQEGFTAKLNEDQLAAMRQKQVKLHFPKGSVADPWTKLGRLRPVYYVYPEVPDDLDAREWYYWPKANKQERKIMNTEDMGGEADDEVLNTRGVCYMQKGFYCKVQYVATGGLESGDIYEVEKLRDKIIQRLPRKDFPDENMGDPNIIRHLEEEGRVLEKLDVLVVKYLVHWAGWPSEDDTYERAQDNIPQSFINEYEEVAGTYAEIPEPARKRRKSEAKKYIRMP
ncbi:hypothetical protein MMC30_006991 [Trapelia coarctata]|nr:hypothetical protein [Trapelia coarctata]